MSYDLFVFDPEGTPRERVSLDEWFDEQTGSEEASADPGVASGALQAWFREASVSFPPLNGPGAMDEAEDLSKCGDYNFLLRSVFVSFPWPEAQRAAEVIPKLAAKHGLGLYDPQRKDESGWYFPRRGELEPLEESGGGRGLLSRVLGRLGGKRS